jgi:DNA-directed RNA polymerase sigma subunit (sigma70/sigma32)
MYHLIQLILQNLTFFALHLKNLTSFPKPLSAKREQLELLQKMKHQGDSEARTELIKYNLRLVS